MGSIVGRLLFGSLSGHAHLTSNPFDPMTIVVAFLGAVVLLAIYNLVKRGSVR
ncbi:hypothetical protein NMD1_02336 [Novosphingobium sp. MD-1]|nr:hypothetical protein NMD1_02336 [Novosphingobium sp. MD-1]